jgi:hypothetical protein
MASPAVILSQPRASGGQTQIGQKIPAREEQRPDDGACRHQLDIPRHQGVKHQPAKPRPRGDQFHRKRAAEQAAYNDAIDDVPRNGEIFEITPSLVSMALSRIFHHCVERH